MVILTGILAFLVFSASAGFVLWFLLEAVDKLINSSQKNEESEKVPVLENKEVRSSEIADEQKNENTVAVNPEGTKQMSQKKSTKNKKISSPKKKAVIKKKTSKSKNKQ
jgi:hypothetical protein